MQQQMCSWITTLKKADSMSTADHDSVEASQPEVACQCAHGLDLSPERWPHLAIAARAQELYEGHILREDDLKPVRDHQHWLCIRGHWQSSPCRGARHRAVICTNTHRYIKKLDGVYLSALCPVAVA